MIRIDWLREELDRRLEPLALSTRLVETIQGQLINFHFFCYLVVKQQLKHLHFIHTHLRTFNLQVIQMHLIIINCKSNAFKMLIK